MKVRIIIFATASLLATDAFAAPAKAGFDANQYGDSIINLKEISVIAAKQSADAETAGSASTLISRAQIERLNIANARDASSIVPNFYIPEYGSRITSSIYVRGMGARIDQPVVGLVVDNVPVLNKDNYDFDIADIESLQMLRGPQSTMYGRNTMGGVINVYTLSPFTFEGVRLGMEYGSGNTQKYRISTYYKTSERVGFSVGAYYSKTDGFFKNLYTGEKCDWERSGGGRFKVQYRNLHGLRIDNTFSFVKLEQGGYPYAYVETGQIAYNDPSDYRRTNFNDGLTIRYEGEKFSVASITSYQYLDDRMNLDQDFLPLSYFTLTQARREHAVTEDLVFRSPDDKAYRWLLGAFGFYRHTSMHAPVLFKEDGIRNLILDRFEPQGIHAEWGEDTFLLDSRFRTPDYGAALYHESTYDAGRWRFTAGLRVDFEASKLHYRSYAEATYTTQTPDGTSYPHAILVDQPGTLKQSFTEILPKISVLYRMGSSRRNTLYATVSKGYKAGGFNTQMFSDVLQQQVMKQMGFGSLYDVADVVTYKPEKSWNYEVGAHLSTPSHKVQADLALFYIDCRDQQLTVFPEGQVTGRLMTNAGRTRSFGGEASLLATLWRNLDLQVAYGYTRATFVKFDTGKADYAGNFIPYAPQHTLYAGASYTLRTGWNWLEYVIFRVAANGAGRIYWNEANTFSQPFYALLEASIRFEHRHWAVDVWGRNLTDTRYDTFYFMSIGNSFLQRGRPRTFGVSLSITL
ncbi:TonB-dependent receptor [Alistipes sp.]|uniref:TonB-dependent receptor n=2 Tax=Bacteroidales TaxID=171549 RepID=UPI0023F06849|nr:TonB-dependent receptor [Alistipes sp.]